MDQQTREVSSYDYSKKQSWEKTKIKIYRDVGKIFLLNKPMIYFMILYHRQEYEFIIFKLASFD